MREAEHLRKISDYLKKNSKKGYTFDSLRWALVAQGYSRTAVEKAINQANKELAAEAPILKEKPTIIHEVMDENDQAVDSRPWWKRWFG